MGRGVGEKLSIVKWGGGVKRSRGGGEEKYSEVKVRVEEENREKEEKE